MLAIFMGSVVADNFNAVMTYEILLIVVLGGLGSISGSVIGAMLFVFSSEWWLRGLDTGAFLTGTYTFWVDTFLEFTINVPGIFRYLEDVFKLDNGTLLSWGRFIFRSGFRLVVFSVIIMIVVLFFHKGIMGDKELPYKLKEWTRKLCALFGRKSKAGENNA